LGIGDWAQSPIPNPQSPIPNPQTIKFKIMIKQLKKTFTNIKKNIKDKNNYI
jgi:hypothetical protein